MRVVLASLLGGMLATALGGAACAQPAPLPASAVAPTTAASQLLPTRSAAITAAENAKEPGAQRPEERVIPQISIPLKPRKGTLAVAASSPAGSVPGGVDDGAARCLAIRDAAEKTACERRSAAAAAAK